MNYFQKGDLVRVECEWVEATSVQPHEFFEGSPKSNFYTLTAGCHLIFTGESYDFKWEGWDSYDEANANWIVEKYFGFQFICLSNETVVWIQTTAREEIWEARAYHEGEYVSIRDAFKIVCRLTNDS